MATAISFSPDAPEMRADPYQTFAELRENDPLHRSHLGYWVVSRYDDVRGVLMNRDDFGQGDFAENGDQGKTGAGSVLTGGRCPDRAVADNVPSLCRRGALPASCDAA